MIRSENTKTILDDNLLDMQLHISVNYHKFKLDSG